MWARSLAGRLVCTGAHAVAFRGCRGRSPRAAEGITGRRARRLRESALGIVVRMSIKKSEGFIMRTLIFKVLVSYLYKISTFSGAFPFPAFCPML